MHKSYINHMPGFSECGLYPAYTRITSDVGLKDTGAWTHFGPFISTISSWASERAFLTIQVDSYLTLKFNKHWGG